MGHTLNFEFIIRKKGQKDRVVKTAESWLGEDMWKATFFDDEIHFKAFNFQEYGFTFPFLIKKHGELVGNGEEYLKFITRKDLLAECNQIANELKEEKDEAIKKQLDEKYEKYC